MSRQFDDLLLGSIELFCRTAEAESFTAAANQAGVTPAAVSRSISRLEARLGVQLFARTTRRIRLTESGRTYYAQCRQALAQLTEAERELSGTQRAPSGTVRISLPTSYGHHRVLPVIPEFMAMYPDIELDLHISNRNVDFFAEEFDLAVRVRVPPDSGLIAHTLERAAPIVVASPDYLKRHGTPRHPDDLAQHSCIQFILPRTGQVIPWTFLENGNERAITPQGRVRCSDDILGVVTLVKHGAGLCQTYRFIVEQELASGELVDVLPEFTGPGRPMSLIYPANRHMPSRVRVLIEFLKQRLGAAR